MFRGRRPFSSSARDYIGDQKDYRYGVSAGVQTFSDESVFINDLTFYKSSGYGIFGKFNFGSPVLLNFMSFSGHIKAMYAVPGKSNDHNITEGRMVYGYGNDINFWLTDNSCVALGFTDERDSVFGTHKNDAIYPSKLRFVFGIKSFF